MVALTADSTLDTIPVGSQPSGMAITPDGLYALASSRESGTVFVLETAGNTVVDSIQVGSLNQLLTVSPDGSLAYVVNSSGGTISVIETAGFTVVATIPVGLNPIDVAFSPDGTRAWVATSGWSKVIATATHTVVDSLNTTGGTRIGVAVSGDGQSVYIGAGNRVLVFAAATAALVDSVTGLASPQLMTTSRDGGSIFVANVGSATVSRISTATNTVTATIAVGGAPVGIATGPDGLIYVAGASILSIINPANNLVIDTVTIPNTALADLAVMPHPVP